MEIFDKYLINPRSDCIIDPDKLEKEAGSLPTLMQNYHEAINDLNSKRDDLKLDLERAEAKAKVDVRNKMISDEQKPSVESVNAEVAMMPSIYNARKELAEYERAITYLKGVLSSLDAKRSSLNNLVTLYSKDYFTLKDKEGAYAEADRNHFASGNMQLLDKSADINKRLSEKIKSRRVL